ncbi:hypothetical protein OHA98_15670 [Streptomyces sp. NBC_00654]|nr:hypothetical protein [Streptomyces sp. NBC_00654]MCX4966249.1 hypothetical protein [Streptomyces sp. NBC_00654]
MTATESGDVRRLNPPRGGTGVRARRASGDGTYDPAYVPRRLSCP